MILAAILALTTAHADDYPYLTFETQDGTTQSVAVSGLTLTIADGNLVAANGTQTLTLALSDLTKMYFASEATSIDELTSKLPADGVAEVFTLAGVSLGHSTLSTLRSTLNAGVYIIKVNGQTLKVMVK
jgi:hypothetical protein